MGAPKGLLDYRGEAWVLAQARAIARAGIGELVVVVGEGWRDRYASALSAVGRFSRGIAIAVNPRIESGILGSVRAAREESYRAGDPSEGVFVLPIDVPAARPEFWAKLAAEASRSGAAVPVLDGRGGHPVALAAEALCQVVALDPIASRLNEWLRERSKRVGVSDPRVGLNLNTPAQWRAFSETAV